MRHLWLILPLATCFLAIADDAEVPALIDPFPFSHADHAETFEQVRLMCVTCHPIGLVQEPPIELGTPTSTCHACHRGEVTRTPVGPDNCLICHVDRAQLVPVDHEINWLRTHGDAARVRKSTCSTCHRTSTCVDCHDRRGPMVKSPHGPGFSAFHGIDARLDPRSCSTCHAPQTCTSCHESGVSPW